MNCITCKCLCGLLGVTTAAVVAVASTSVAAPIAPIGAQPIHTVGPRAMQPADPVSGDWKGEVTGEAFPEPLPLVVEFSMNEKHEVLGTFVIPDGEAPFKGVFDPRTALLTGSVTPEDGSNWEIELELDGDEFSGTAVETNSGVKAEIELERIEG